MFWSDMRWGGLELCNRVVAHHWNNGEDISVGVCPNITEEIRLVICDHKGFFVCFFNNISRTSVNKAECAVVLEDILFTWVFLWCICSNHIIRYCVILMTKSNCEHVAVLFKAHTYVSSLEAEVFFFPITICCNRQYASAFKY